MYFQALPSRFSRTSLHPAGPEPFRDLDHEEIGSSEHVHVRWTNSFQVVVPSARVLEGGCVPAQDADRAIVDRIPPIRQRQQSGQIPNYGNISSFGKSVSRSNT